MNYKDIASLGKVLRDSVCTAKFPKKIKVLLGSKITAIITLEGLDRNIGVIRGILTLDDEYDNYVVGSTGQSMAVFEIGDVVEIDQHAKSVKLMYRPTLE